MLPVFADSLNCYSLDHSSYQQLNEVFTKMMIAQKSEYPFREDLLRNYVSEIFHLALKSLGTQFSKTLIFE